MTRPSVAASTPLEYRRWRRLAAEGAVVAHVDPTARRSGLSLNPQGTMQPPYDFPGTLAFD